MKKNGTKSPSNALNSHGLSGLYGLGPEGKAAWENDVELVRELRAKMPKQTLKP